MLGWQELLIILIIILILFGANRVPKLAEALGKGVRSFKKGLKGVEEKIDTEGEDKKKDKEKDTSSGE